MLVNGRTAWEPVLVESLPWASGLLWGVPGLAAFPLCHLQSSSCILCPWGMRGYHSPSLQRAGFLMVCYKSSGFLKSVLFSYDTILLTATIGGFHGTWGWEEPVPTCWYSPGLLFCNRTVLYFWSRSLTSSASIHNTGPLPYKLGKTKSWSDTDN
jgi:hypothetical protein